MDDLDCPNCEAQMERINAVRASADLTDDEAICLEVHQGEPRFECPECGHTERIEERE